MSTTRDLAMKAHVGGTEGRVGWRRHVLDLDDFTREDIELVLKTADAMKEIMGRDIRKVPALRGRTIITLFYEVSTRTRVSFEQAGKILSADVINVTASGSSVSKGESLIDTGKTLQAMGADIIVMRHPSSGAPYLLAQWLNCGIINAGDGWHAHPSQALLDLYTMRDKLKHIEGLRVTLVGDVLHSRVARSNIWGLLRMGADVVLCGPPTLLPHNFIEAYPAKREGMGTLRIEYDMERAVQGADVVMALRLQLERQQAGLLPSLREYSERWQVNAKHLASASPNVLVMHPGPVNRGVEIAADLVDQERSLMEEQVRNGVAIRMALLYMMLAGSRGGDDGLERAGRS